MHDQVTLQHHQPTSPYPRPDMEGTIWADIRMHGDSDTAFLASKPEAAR